jgi:hypothetical protein
VKAPHKKMAATYHSALKSDHDNKTVTSKHKTLLRDVAETSQRSMLTDLTGMLAIRCMVVQPDQAPTCLKFEEDRTTPGCNLARELYAMARGVPKSHVFFSPCQLLINIDDKASMYSAFTGDGTGNGKSSDANEEVIVSRNDSRQGYDYHNENDNSKDFNGIKSRFTNLITAGGNYGTCWLQVLNFSPSEM